MIMDVHLLFVFSSVNKLAINIFRTRSSFLSAALLHYIIFTVCLLSRLFVVFLFFMPYPSNFSSSIHRVDVSVFFLALLRIFFLIIIKFALYN